MAGTPARTSIDKRTRHVRLRGKGALPALAAGLSFVACASFGGTPEGSRLHTMQASPNYAEGVFVNRLPTETDFGFAEGLALLREALSGPQIREPEEPVNVVALSAADLQGAASDDLRVRWLGHSTLLIEIEGKRILTDPIWSERASPVRFAGPKRFQPPVVAFADLPRIDAVLISHDHYDHLDVETIRMLGERRVPIFVPLGVGAHLERWGIARAQIREYDWWQEAELDGLRIACTPARHFSGRSLTDRNETLWASWAVIGQRRRVFFSGDTGLFPEFEDIGRRHGPFDMTFLEVGAYNTRWANVHMGPEQAVMAHKALGGRVLVPIHWGLFNLALHTWTEPAERLLAAAGQSGITLALPRPGEALEPAEWYANERWWPAIPWQTAHEAPVRSSHMPAEWLARYGPFSKPDARRVVEAASKPAAPAVSGN